MLDILQSIAYHPLLGLPVIGWLGILSYLVMWATALTMILSRRKIVRIKPKVHFRLAYSMAIIASLHALLAIASNL